ncbi:acyltransferase family protein [Pseudooceanicola sp. 200-1SW]|uniref:acyltransferase family protein n=1 Tax=Pseudooceanicola sp. 200-1SW TaxID=3425949 RepID=UPI003D7F8B29
MYHPLDKTLPSLNGLRGFAALMVLVSHSANAGMLPEILGEGMGQVGVCLFYALSGFLMAHVTFGREMTRDSVGSYMLARLSRVLPLFYLLVFLNTLLFLALGEAFYSFDTLGDVAGNWLLLRGSGVFWSIPIEIHFYLLFLAIWWAQGKGLLLSMLAALMGLALLAMPLLKSGLGDTRTLAFWLHFFLIGVLVRWLLDTGARNLLPRADSRAAPAGPGLIALSWGVFALLLLTPPQIRAALGLRDYPNPFDAFVIALLPVLMWFTLRAAGPFRLFSGRLLTWFGQISFSLYLLHAPFLTIVNRLDLTAHLPPLLCFALFLACATGAAALSFRLVERPAQAWLRGSRRHPGKRTAPAPSA